MRTTRYPEDCTSEQTESVILVILLREQSIQSARLSLQLSELAPPPPSPPHPQFERRDRPQSRQRANSAKLFLQSSELAPPAHQQGSVAPLPLVPKGVGHTRLLGEGAVAGEPIRTKGQALGLLLVGTIL